MNPVQLVNYQAENFLWDVEGTVATITLNRPERKNPLTFESYAELRDLFRQLAYAKDIHVVIFRGAGGNFCSGGDVHEIIGPLTKMDMTQLLDFTRMTGDLVKAMRACPQPIISAVEGICAGAGAIIAMASDMRYGSQMRKRHSCLPAWGWRAVTWVPVPCFPALSASVTPPTCCTQGAQ